MRPEDGPDPRGPGDTTTPAEEASTARPAEEPPPRNPFAEPGSQQKLFGDPNPYARPTRETDLEAQLPLGQSKAPEAGPARRLAGAFMILNGVFVLLELNLGAPTAQAPLKTISYIPAGLDLLIGLTLVMGSPKLAGFAIVRAALGLTVGAMMRAKEGPFLVAYQMLLCGSFLGLLIGEAGRARMAVAGSLTGLALAAEGLMVGGAAMGRYPLASLVMASSGEIEPNPVEKATGRMAPYEITFPSSGWYERSRSALAKEGPALDRWFIRPSLDLHVLVLAEQFPGSQLTADAYTDAVLENAKKDSPGMNVLSRETWPLFPHSGRLVQAVKLHEGVEYTWRYAFVTANDRGYHVAAFGTTKAMADEAAEISAILGSFRLPRDVLDALPPELDPALVSEMRGRKVPYSLKVPSERWRVRKPESYAATSPHIDQWMSHVDFDAQVFVMFEEVQGEIDLALFATAVIDGAKKDKPTWNLESREAWAKYPKNGVRLRATAEVEGVRLAWEYALWASGGRGYQIVALAPVSALPRIGEDLTRAVDSFTPAP